MGFLSSIGSIFKSAAPAIGTAVGGAFGGPAGAAIGGALGTGIAGSGGSGGPSSLGGITGLQPGQGASTGREARSYYENAFPGTNPWEHLGAGNPMGAILPAALQSKTQMRNVDKQAQTARQNVQTQTSTQSSIAANTVAANIAVAKIHGRAAGVEAAQNQAPGAEKKYGDYISEGTDPAITQPGARMETATAATMTARAHELDSWTRTHEMDIKARAQDMAEGAHFKDPGTAKLAALASQAFKIGMSQTEFVKWMQQNPKKLAALGVAVRGASGAAKMLQGVFGRVKLTPSKTSVGARGQKPMSQSRIERKRGDNAAAASYKRSTGRSRP